MRHFFLPFTQTDLHKLLVIRPESLNSTNYISDLFFFLYKFDRNQRPRINCNFKTGGHKKLVPEHSLTEFAWFKPKLTRFWQQKGRKPDFLTLIPIVHPSNYTVILLRLIYRKVFVWCGAEDYFPTIRFSGPCGPHPGPLRIHLGGRSKSTHYRIMPGHALNHKVFTTEMLY